MSPAQFSPLMSEEQIAALADAAVADLASRLAARAFRPLPSLTAPDAADQGAAPVWEPAQGDALARLHTLLHLQRAVERLTDQAAREAAEAGAGYPQLGDALEMSRQGARKRWPGLVGAPPRPAAGPVA
ncbi:hypothetical protein OG455_03655 [Kitasatospora sp. NBC_01287]|uniref:hypothetical protein n=1 Tax=Kitasatospora sp. NBC_01287 TaxID=2903573 RepID=UPI002259D204|nr:hypothetical protein [Kitasatospora sp. NBC_01287]MCX4744625.1 hypothetical protein [Kitasatospora sp. NBC_01287]